ncbi:Alkaline phosphatase synthesis transcriptional regulatory protein PhoP [Maioricimonas rarisocia]|uniref:Alkaline phosphatase synthesis transcriptional regulatory protein PhoP n=1 Tax=Maioricimonas rarisocia TaxID=2528026 RepID=A0A517ZCA2_9PLAN|nr:response regulator [Maioricimonas rarisocia]QDU40134.1 Alkaline phosphatase synthesis transcriptional regulatory protein PhoP [Maioricimonas rarisocia]
MATVKPRVLVVEDNRVMADVVRFNLTRADMDVKVAFNGRAALAAFNAGQFDLVITDYQMPEMSGEELCRAIRGGEHNALVPILLVSAKGYELDIQGLVEEFSLSRVLFKPFSPRDVVETARSLVEPAASPGGTE